MPKWAKRLQEIRDRNPAALPPSLRGGPPEAAWYRVAWQTDEGVSPEDAARPVVLMLGWLARRGLLTREGVATFKATASGDVASVALTRAMVVPKGAAFLDAQWEQWWDTNGINLTISPNGAEQALAAIDTCWQSFGKPGGV